MNLNPKPVFKIYLMENPDIRWKHFPLHKAVADGNAARVDALLAARPGRVDERDYIGDTALKIACVLVKSEMVVKLLEAGADPNAENLEGVRAISGIYYRRNADLLRLLLRYGADVDFHTRTVPGISNEMSRPQSFLFWAEHIAGWPEGLRILEEWKNRHAAHLQRWNLNARLKRRRRERGLSEHVWKKKVRGHKHVGSHLKGFLNHTEGKLEF